MIVDDSFYNDIEQRLQSLSKSKEKYSINVEGGFGKVPVLEIVRALDNSYAMDIDAMDRIAHYCLMGKALTVYKGGIQIGSPIVINAMDDSWDSFITFEQEPMALQFVLSVCAAHILKKSIPLPISTPTAAGIAQDVVKPSA